MLSKAGSRGYTAPEVENGTFSYGFSCDYYSLGVNMYQILHLKLPSYSSGVLQLRKNTTRQCAKLLEALLERTPEKRIGCVENSPMGWSEVKKHVFFSSLDWSAVESGALSGSIQPRSFENISVTSIDSVFSHTSDKQSFMSSKIEESFAELEYNLTL